MNPTLKEVSDFLRRLRVEQKVARFVLIYETPGRDEQYICSNAPSRDYIQAFLVAFLADEMSGTGDVQEAWYDGVDFIPKPKEGSDEKGN